MTTRRDPDAILAAWLEEGPDLLPESTRRAIEVTTRTNHQARRLAWLPWRATNVNGMTRLALVAAAAVAVVVGGLFVLTPATDRPGGVGGPGSPVPSASVTPSASASTEASIPAMTQTFTSAKHGYSVRYPADWMAAPATTDGPWTPQVSDTADAFDFIAPAVGGPFRAGSAVVPEGVAIDDWISQYITVADPGPCALPRSTLEQVMIDGRPGRLRGWCGDPPATEIEATVVVNNRVYVFTLFRGDGAGASEATERALFDAFTETISLNPEDAEASPGPSPS